MEKEYIYGVKLINSGFLKKIKTSMSLNEHDFVIVEEVNEYGSLLFVGQVMTELSGGDFHYNAQIIQRVDLSDYMKELRKQEKKAELKNKLETEIQNYDPLEVAEALSKTNETIKELYEEYKSLC